MKKTLCTLSLLLMTVLCYCQEKIPEKYIVQVTYTAGGTENIEVENYRHVKVAPPILKDGSIFFDEEYLLLDVRKIKILETIYSKNTSTVRKSKYKIDTGYYWNYQLARYVKVNVISDPEWERAQREAEARAGQKTVFEKMAEGTPEKKEPFGAIKPEKDIEKDTIVVSTEQIVCEVDGKRIRAIKNSTLRLEGNSIKYRWEEDLLQENFIKEDLHENSEDYSVVSQLSLRKGIYIIEKKLNKSGKIVSVKNVEVKLID